MDYNTRRKLKKNKHGAFMGIGLYNKKDNPKIYSIWQQMIYRVYEDSKDKKPTYQNCKVCDEWLCFQNFASWYVKNHPNDGNNYHLDKDIVFKDNKEYSPNKCFFVPQSINKLLTNRKRFRGDYPVGVHVPETYIKNGDIKYQAGCSNGKGKIIRGKVRETMLDAFIDYSTIKKNIILEQLEIYKNVLDEKVYNSLKNYVIIDDTIYKLHEKV